MNSRWSALAVAAMALFLTSCSSDPSASGTTTTTGSASESTTTGTDGATPPKESPAPVETPAKPTVQDKPKEGDEVVVMDTSAGKIVLMLFSEAAPKTVANFTKLAKSGFYDGTRFHRTIPGFMIQGGDPNSKDKGKANTWGQGGPGYSIEDEIAGMTHTPGILSMANAGPNTGGSQFFIMDGDAPFLDTKHAIFGKVVEGTEVVSKIVQSPVMDAASGMVDPDKAYVVKSVKIESWPVK